MGTLYIVATPIGNLEDISFRAIRILLTSDIIACEDTRQTGILRNHLRNTYMAIFKLEKNENQQLVSYRDQNENQVVPELIQQMINGQSVSLVSDSGTPVISDPGYLLVRKANENNIPVVPVPGASAFLAALVSSGLPADNFRFHGFPPDKSMHAVSLLKDIGKNKNRRKTTHIFYVSPHKYYSFIQAIAETLGNIDIVIGREYTKKFEEHYLTDIKKAMSRPVPAGEIVLLFNC